ncbi:hypothetical protein GQ600_3591 [Phytophthora cactorum]|nr:hypothetical protein GQ600_3591 [Phytophthora cactorum]
MVDVYEGLKATGNTPLITFGSLLGAVRNGSMIPSRKTPTLGSSRDSSSKMSKSLTRNFAVPYVDLYKMKKVNDSLWDIQELVGSNGRFLPGDKVEPFSQVTINGMPFDTVHDPQFFLTEAYGPNYMTPKPRRSALVKPNVPVVTKNATTANKFTD